MAIPDGEGEFRALLPQSMGYGVVVGIGFAFAALMLALTYLQKRFTNANPQSAAEFASAGRSVKPGLIAAGVVSAWTWSATLLQSSTSAYQLGLSAAWWYAAGGAIQVLMFAAVAAKVKQNANGATTFLQIVKARYGTATHLLFTFYALACFHVVAASLVLGCAATVNALTGESLGTQALRRRFQCSPGSPGRRNERRRVLLPPTHRHRRLRDRRRTSCDFRCGFFAYYGKRRKEKRSLGTRSGS